ncbi:hypothetical protein ACSX1C_00310 [Pseudomonas sp. MBLB4123]|uniref:hypothetical protein n=1 Tax=Pseudomonas sp. MBLB4123 TaxID=3451557 RepID=UPI003F7509AA
MSNHTADTLYELDRLRTECFISNGVSVDGELNKFYELSHICPVNSKGLLGLLHPHNLVITEKQYNRARGTRYSGGGKFISRLELKSEWAVDNDTPAAKVYDKIEKFLGQTLKDYLTEHAPKLSYKERLVNKLVRHSLQEQEFKTKEARKQYEDKLRRSLQHMPVEQLELSVAERELSLSSFNRSHTRYFPLMMEEAKRFKSYGVKIDASFEAYAEYLQSAEDVFFDTKERLQIESNDCQENEWAAPSLQYWFGQQLCKMLHKEKPDLTFNGKPYAQCFTLPGLVEAGWTPEHRVEEWKVAQYGMPPVRPKPVYQPPLVLDDSPLPWEVDGYVCDHSSLRPVFFKTGECPF